MRYFKITLICLACVFFLVGATVGILYLTGKFDREVIQPEDISFEITEKLTEEDFKTTILTTTENVTEKEVTLSLTNQIPAEEGYITDGVITIPQKVRIGKEFTVKVNKTHYEGIEEEWNVGGTSVIRAKSSNPLIQEAQPLEVKVDVPVKSVEVELYSLSGNLIKQTTQSAVRPMSNVRPLAENGDVVELAVGSVISLRAKFTPEESKYNANGNLRKVLFEIPTAWKGVYIDFYDGNNDKIEILRQTTVEDIKINCYCFRTSQDELDALALGYSDDDLMSLMNATGVSGASSQIFGTNQKINNFKSDNTDETLFLSINQPVTLYANKPNVENGEFDLGLEISADVGEASLGDKIGVIKMYAYYLDGGTWVDAGSNLVVEGERNSSKVGNGVRAKINKNSADLSTWKVVASNSGTYKLVVSLSYEYYSSATSTPTIISFDVEYGHIVVSEPVTSTIEWAPQMPESQTLTILDGRNELEKYYPSIKLSDFVKIYSDYEGLEPTYKVVKYFAYSESGANLTDIIDCTLYSLQSEVPGSSLKYDVYEISDGRLLVKNIGTFKIFFTTVKSDYLGNVTLQNGKYVVDSYSDIRTIDVIKSLQSLNVQMMVNETGVEGQDYNKNTNPQTKDYIYHVRQQGPSVLTLALTVSDIDIFERDYENGAISIKFIINDDETDLLTISRIQNNEGQPNQVLFDVSVGALPSSFEPTVVCRVEYSVDPRLNTFAMNRGQIVQVKVLNGFVQSIEFECVQNMNNSANNPIIIKTEPSGTQEIDGVKYATGIEHSITLGGHAFTAEELSIVNINEEALNKKYTLTSSNQSVIEVIDGINGENPRLVIWGSTEEVDVVVTATAEDGSEISADLYFKVLASSQIEWLYKNQPISSSGVTVLGVEGEKLLFNDFRAVAHDNLNPGEEIDLKYLLSYSVDVNEKLEQSEKLNITNDSVQVLNTFGTPANAHLMITTNFGAVKIVPVTIQGVVKAGNSNAINNNDVGLDDKDFIERGEAVPTERGTRVYAEYKREITFNLVLTQSNGLTTTLEVEEDEFTVPTNLVTLVKENGEIYVTFYPVSKPTEVVIGYKKNFTPGREDDFGFSTNLQFVVYPNAEIMLCDPNNSDKIGQEERPVDYICGQSVLFDYTDETNGVIGFERKIDNSDSVIVNNLIIQAYFDGEWRNLERTTVVGPNEELHSVVLFPSIRAQIGGHIDVRAVYCGYATNIITVYLNPHFDNLPNLSVTYNGVKYIPFVVGQNIELAKDPGVMYSIINGTNETLIEIRDGQITTPSSRMTYSDILTSEKLSISNNNGTIELPILILPIDYPFVRYDELPLDKEEITVDLKYIIDDMFDEIDASDNTRIDLTDKLKYTGDKTINIFNQDGSNEKYIELIEENDRLYIQAYPVGERKRVNVVIRCGNEFDADAVEFTYRLDVVANQSIQVLYPYLKGSVENYTSYPYPEGLDQTIQQDYSIAEFVYFDGKGEISVNLLENFDESIHPNFDFASEILGKGNERRFLVVNNYTDSSKRSVSQNTKINFSISKIFVGENVLHAGNSAIDNYAVIAGQNVLTIKKSSVYDNFSVVVKAETASGASAEYTFTALANRFDYVTYFNQEKVGEQSNTFASNELTVDFSKSVVVNTVGENNQQQTIDSYVYDFMVKLDEQFEDYNQLIEFDKQTRTLRAKSALVENVTTTIIVYDFRGEISRFKLVLCATLDHEVKTNGINSTGTFNIGDGVLFFNSAPSKITYVMDEVETTVFVRDYLHADYGDVWKNQTGTFKEVGGYKYTDISSDYSQYVYVDCIKRYAQDQFVQNEGSIAWRRFPIQHDSGNKGYIMFNYELIYIDGEENNQTLTFAIEPGDSSKTVTYNLSDITVENGKAVILPVLGFEQYETRTFIVYRKSVNESGDTEILPYPSTCDVDSNSMSSTDGKKYSYVTVSVNNVWTTLRVAENLKRAEGDKFAEKDKIGTVKILYIDYNDARYYAKIDSNDADHEYVEINNVKYYFTRFYNVDYHALIGRGNGDKLQTFRYVITSSSGLNIKLSNLIYVRLNDKYYQIGDDKVRNNFKIYVNDIELEEEGVAKSEFTIDSLSEGDTLVNIIIKDITGNFCVGMFDIAITCETQTSTQVNNVNIILPAGDGRVNYEIREEDPKVGFEIWGEYLKDASENNFKANEKGTFDGDDNKDNGWNNYVYKTNNGQITNGEIGIELWGQQQVGAYLQYSSESNASVKIDIPTDQWTFTYKYKDEEENEVTKTIEDDNFYYEIKYHVGNDTTSTQSIKIIKAADFSSNPLYLEFGQAATITLGTMCQQGCENKFMPMGITHFIPDKKIVETKAIDNLAIEHLRQELGVEFTTQEINATCQAYNFAFDNVSNFDGIVIETGKFEHEGYTFNLVKKFAKVFDENGNLCKFDTDDNKGLLYKIPDGGYLEVTIYDYDFIQHKYEGENYGYDATNNSKTVTLNLPEDLNSTSYTISVGNAEKPLNFTKPVETTETNEIELDLIYDDVNNCYYGEFTVDNISYLGAIEDSTWPENDEHFTLDKDNKKIIISNWNSDKYTFTISTKVVKDVEISAFEYIVDKLGIRDDIFKGGKWFGEYETLKDLLDNCDVKLENNKLTITTTNPKYSATFYVVNKETQYGTVDNPVSYLHYAGNIDQIEKFKGKDDCLTGAYKNIGDEPFFLYSDSVDSKTVYFYAVDTKKKIDIKEFIKNELASEDQKNSYVNELKAFFGNVIPDDVENLYYEVEMNDELSTANEMVKRGQLPFNTIKILQHGYAIGNINIYLQEFNSPVTETSKELYENSHMAITYASQTPVLCAESFATGAEYVISYNNNEEEIKYNFVVEQDDKDDAKYRISIYSDDGKVLVQYDEMENMANSEDTDASADYVYLFTDEFGVGIIIKLRCDAASSSFKIQATKWDYQVSSTFDEGNFSNIKQEFALGFADDANAGLDITSDSDYKIYKAEKNVNEKYEEKIVFKDNIKLLSNESGEEINPLDDPFGTADWIYDIHYFKEGGLKVSNNKNGSSIDIEEDMSKEDKKIYVSISNIKSDNVVLSGSYDFVIELEKVPTVSFGENTTIDENLNIKGADIYSGEVKTMLISEIFSPNAGNAFKDLGKDGDKCSEEGLVDYLLKNRNLQYLKAMRAGEDGEYDAKSTKTNRFTVIGEDIYIIFDGPNGEKSIYKLGESEDGSYAEGNEEANPGDYIYALKVSAIEVDSEYKEISPENQISLFLALDKDKYSFTSRSTGEGENVSYGYNIVAKYEYKAEVILNTNAAEANFNDESGELIFTGKSVVTTTPVIVRVSISRDGIELLHAFINFDVKPAVSVTINYPTIKDWDGNDHLLDMEYIYVHDYKDDKFLYFNKASEYSSDDKPRIKIVEDYKNKEGVNLDKKPVVTLKFDNENIFIGTQTGDNLETGYTIKEDFSFGTSTQIDTKVRVMVDDVVFAEYKIRLCKNPVITLVNQVQPQDMEDGKAVIPIPYTGNLLTEGYLGNGDPAYPRVMFFYAGYALHKDYYGKLIELTSKTQDSDPGINEYKVPSDKGNEDVSVAFKNKVTGTSIGTFNYKTVWNKKMECNLPSSLIGKKIYYSLQAGQTYDIEEVFGITHRDGSTFTSDGIQSFTAVFTGSGANDDGKLLQLPVGSSTRTFAEIKQVDGKWKLVVNGASEDGPMAHIEIKYFGKSACTDEINLILTPNIELVLNLSDPYDESRQMIRQPSSTSEEGNNSSSYSEVISTKLANGLTTNKYLEVLVDGVVNYTRIVDLTYKIVDSNIEGVSIRTEHDGNGNINTILEIEHFPKLDNKFITVEVSDIYGYKLLFGFCIGAQLPIEVATDHIEFTTGDQVIWTEEQPFPVKFVNQEISANRYLNSSMYKYETYKEDNTGAFVEYYTDTIADNFGDESSMRRYNRTLYGVLPNASITAKTYNVESKEIKAASDFATIKVAAGKDTKIAINGALVEKLTESAWSAGNLKVVKATSDNIGTATLNDEKTNVNWTKVTLTDSQDVASGIWTIRVDNNALKNVKANNTVEAISDGPYYIVSGSSVLAKFKLEVVECDSSDLASSTFLPFTNSSNDSNVNNNVISWDLIKTIAKRGSNPVANVPALNGNPSSQVRNDNGEFVPCALINDDGFIKGFEDGKEYRITLSSGSSDITMQFIAIGLELDTKLYVNKSTRVNGEFSAADGYTFSYSFRYNETEIITKLENEAETIYFFDDVDNFNFGGRTELYSDLLITINEVSNNNDTIQITELDTVGVKMTLKLTMHVNIKQYQSMNGIKFDYGLEGESIKTLMGKSDYPYSGRGSFKDNITHPAIGENETMADGIDTRYSLYTVMGDNSKLLDSETFQKKVTPIYKMTANEGDKNVWTKTFDAINYIYNNNDSTLTISATLANNSPTIDNIKSATIDNIKYVTESINGNEVMGLRIGYRQVTMKTVRNESNAIVRYEYVDDNGNIYQVNSNNTNLSITINVDLFGEATFNNKTYQFALDVDYYMTVVTNYESIFVEFKESGYSLERATVDNKTLKEKANWNNGDNKRRTVFKIMINDKCVGRLEPANKNSSVLNQTYDDATNKMWTGKINNREVILEVEIVDGKEIIKTFTVGETDYKSSNVGTKPEWSENKISKISYGNRTYWGQWNYVVASRFEDIQAVYGASDALPIYKSWKGNDANSNVSFNPNTMKLTIGNSEYNVSRKSTISGVEHIVYTDNNSESIYGKLTLIGNNLKLTKSDESVINLTEETGNNTDWATAVKLRDANGYITSLSGAKNLLSCSCEASGFSDWCFGTIPDGVVSVGLKYSTIYYGKYSVESGDVFDLKIGEDDQYAYYDQNKVKQTGNGPLASIKVGNVPLLRNGEVLKIIFVSYSFT